MWFDKRYYSLNYFLKNTFGEKLAKLSLDAGFTCPNRDGTKGVGGCSFCSEKGSGDFTADRKNLIWEQIENAKMQTSNKWKTNKYIAYFQAFTNTYAPIDVLESVYTEALAHEDIVAISIATRPDCVNKDVVDLLSMLREKYKKMIFVELGLQTSKYETAIAINRCFENIEFENACNLLKKADINIICHVIFGLPFETKQDMLNTVRYACDNGIDGIKLQLLHVLKNTGLEEMYMDNKFKTLSFDEYIDLVISALEIIPPNVVIHRLTGDGPSELLISPLWSKDKRKVLNTIDMELRNKNTYQGKFYK